MEKKPQTLRKFRGLWGVQPFKKTTVWVFDPDPDVGRAPTDCASIVALQPFFIAYPFFHNHDDCI